MKAVYIEESAIRYIAQERTFQSGEFEDVINLLHFFKNGGTEFIGHLHCHESKGVGYVYTDNAGALLKSLVIDFTLVPDFVEKDSAFVGTLLQKVVKFAVKIWNNYPLTQTEKLISDCHAIVFPFPYSEKTQYKLLINLQPRKDYTEKRQMSCLYVSNQGGGVFETSGYQMMNVKILQTEAKQICVPSKKQDLKTGIVTAMQVTSLDDCHKAGIQGMMSYHSWLPCLSKSQKEFVTKTLLGNERLEGAAGTGKTISLILRAIFLCLNAKEEDKEMRIIFLCHSIATKESLKLRILASSPIEHILESSYSKQSIELITLQEWCAKNLGSSVGQTEMLDVDAQECKDIQYKLVEEIYWKCKKEDFETYRPYCSEKFIDYFENTNPELIIEAITGEISVTIKGRAACDLDVYKTLPRLVGSIPLESDGDFNFIYLIYEKYQSTLDELGYFDNDDISLSSSLQLATPIWRRRRQDLGYDVVIIDESHLFSYNEYGIFHYLSKDERNPHIIYAIDRSQAIGDRGLSDDTLFAKMHIGNSAESRFNTVFRSAPQIIDLAFSILSSGADMFLNFENPMEKVLYSFTSEDEQKATKPIYKLCPTDDNMIEETFKCVDKTISDLAIRRDKVLIVSVNNEIEQKLEKYAREHNKPCEVLMRRGDYLSIQNAEQKNSYVLGYIDYIGGLEFDAVILVGVDKGRVPQFEDGERALYQSYAWHNRMYVAITRAKYSLIMLGNKSRSESVLLGRAIENNQIDVIS